MRLRNYKFITYADKSPCHQLPSHQPDQDYKSNHVSTMLFSTMDSVLFLSNLIPFFSAKHSMFYMTPINGFTILASI